VPRRILSDARMTRKKEIDSCKAAIVEKAFDEAKSAVLALGKKEKARILKNLADNGSRQITTPLYTQTPCMQNSCPGHRSKTSKTSA